MKTELTRNQLIELVTRIIECQGTEIEIDGMINLLKASVPHPEVTDMIFYPREGELTPEQIVDRALAYRGFQL